MMTQALYTGISGIQANQKAIDITSDNLANISTVGFRGSQAEFSTLFEEYKNEPNTSFRKVSLLNGFRSGYSCPTPR